MVNMVPKGMQQRHEERGIQNSNVLIYRLVEISYELIYHCMSFNIIYIMRTNMESGKIWHFSGIVGLASESVFAGYLTARPAHAGLTVLFFPGLLTVFPC
jgi:hypothetical protein